NKHELILSSKPQLTSSSMYSNHKPCSSIIHACIVECMKRDSVQIKCSYDENYSAEVKHLCKGKCFTPDALKIVQSDEDHDKNPKISVKNDTELNLFTVNMTELRAEDAGKYWCAVKDTFNLPLELMIVMKEGEDVYLEESQFVTREASVGGSASISCKHIRNQNQSVFCRGDQPNICIRDGVRVSSNNRINSRFSLTEESSAGVFTVNISDLRAEDSGKYWCAEESSGSFIFTEVQLHLTRGKRLSSCSLSVISGFSVTAVVSVGLILLALVTVLLLFKLKHNRHGESTVQSVKCLTCMLFFMNCIFCFLQAQEEIQDARHHSDSDPESTPLYSTVQLPTIPSDSQTPVYSTVQLPTIPSDSQTPVYSTVQLPTIPSDSQTPVYSTVQLPTIPSDSQTPVYSTVQLPTIPSDSQTPFIMIIVLDAIHFYFAIQFILLGCDVYISCRQ
uniref:Immunoglobulin domain-containing protein n=1 Tax=Cyprinus carpio TaxID=7962 RepID=A0A8C2D995_CYPCA